MLGHEICENLLLLYINYLNDVQEGNILQLIIWPPQSPDINSIALLWNEMNRSIPEPSPTSAKEYRTPYKNSDPINFTQFWRNKQIHMYIITCVHWSGNATYSFCFPF